MKNKLIYLSSLFLLVLGVGVFWGSWLGMTRNIENLSATEFIDYSNFIMGNVLTPMRIIVPISALLVLLSLFVYKNKKSTEFYAGVLSFTLIVVIILLTAVVIVPIDREIKGWAPERMEMNWEAIRDTWKMFHAVRVVAALLCLFCYSLFVLSDKETES